MSIITTVSLLNSNRKKVGNHTVGFLNIVMYSSYGVNGSSYFQDVTVGNNKCCSHKPSQFQAYDILCCGSGFYATPGWDPVTGLGSIRFAQIAKLTWTNALTYSFPPTAAPTLLPGFIFGNQTPVVTYIIYAGLGLVIFAIVFRTVMLIKSKWQREEKIRRKSRVALPLESIY